MSVECQVNVKSQSELGIGGRETCYLFAHVSVFFVVQVIGREKSRSKSLVIGA